MAKQAPHKIVYVRIAPEIVNAVKELAFEEDRSMSNMIEVILKRYLEEKDKLPKEDRLPNLVSSQAVTVGAKVLDLAPTL